MNCIKIRSRLQLLESLFFLMGLCWIMILIICCQSRKVQRKINSVSINARFSDSVLEGRNDGTVLLKEQSRETPSPELVPSLMLDNSPNVLMWLWLQGSAFCG